MIHVIIFRLVGELLYEKVGGGVVSEEIDNLMYSNENITSTDNGQRNNK